MKILKYLLLCSFTLFINTINGQDFHLSQLQLAPLALNPALTGAACGPRITTAYRNQWASILKANAFQTAALAYDHPIFLKNGDKIGIGISTYFDQAGQLDFRTLSGELMGAYHKKIGSNPSQTHFLSGGLSFGLNERSIDFTNAQWASQHDGEGSFDPSLPAGESFDRDNFLFVDLKLGIHWQSTFSNGNTFQTGFSMAHFNRPNQSFDPSTDLPLYVNYKFYGQAVLNISKKIALTPKLFISEQGLSFGGIGGTGLQFLLKEHTQNTIEIGSAVRIVNRAAPFINGQTTIGNTFLWADALIFNLNYTHQKFIIGLSYDYNISDLERASNGNGAYEAVLIYRFCNK